MTRPRAPRTIEEAAALAAGHAQIEGRLAAVQAQRGIALARINRVADAAATLLLAQLEVVKAQLEQWWDAQGAALAPKGRKSMELGGCYIGTRTARARLAHGFADDKAAAAALRGTRLGNQTTRVSYSIDRAATLKLLQGEGKAAQTLATAGFRVEPAATIFYVERAEQAGTVGAGR